MVNTEKKLKFDLGENVIFAFLIIFALGQIIRINFNLIGTNITLQPIDLIAGFSLIPFVGKKLKEPRVYKYIASFIIIAIFSQLLALTQFKATEVIKGTLYLIRFISYSSLFVLVFNYAKTKDKNKILINTLIFIAFIIASLGWIQYFLFPNFWHIKFLGWDEHLYRLVGTFLDSGFTGIMLVLGFFATLYKSFEKNSKKLSLLLIFMLVSIAFTYSRSSFLGMFLGMTVSFLITKRKKRVVLYSVIFTVILALLPRPGGEGVKLERVSSVHSRFSDYGQILTIARQNTLIGVGYNNLCVARNKYLNDTSFDSHACSGSDSSLLLVFATTGVIGLLTFIYMGIKILGSVNNDIYGKAFLASSAALFAHSVFVNSLFYPWVMGWMAILLAISIKE